MSRRYPQSFKDRAVRMVLERLEDEDAPARFTVIRQTAQKLSVASEGLRRWVVGAEVDSGKKAGVCRGEQREGCSGLCQQSGTVFSVFAGCYAVACARWPWWSALAWAFVSYPTDEW